MRISDWSSDVCSSDLLVRLHWPLPRQARGPVHAPTASPTPVRHRLVDLPQSWRETTGPPLYHGGMCRQIPAETPEIARRPLMSPSPVWLLPRFDRGH